MKLRILLSILFSGAYWVFLKMFALFYSPLTGAASAQQVNDSVTSYAAAKFIRDGGVQSIVWYSLLIVLAVIWLSPILRLFTSKTTETTKS